MKINETHPRAKGTVLLGHCQNILDDPRITVAFVCITVAFVCINVAFDCIIVAFVCFNVAFVCFTHFFLVSLLLLV